MKVSRGEARLKQALQGILDTATTADELPQQPLDPFEEATAAAAAAGIFSPATSVRLGLLPRSTDQPLVSIRVPALQLSIIICHVLIPEG